MPEGMLPKIEPPAQSPTAVVSASSNFQQRLVSALVMAAVSLGLVYAGTTPFAVLVLAGSLMISWEWCNIVRGATADVGILVHVGAVAVAVMLTAGGYPALGLCALLIGAACVVPVVGSRSILSAIGVFYAGLPSIALLWLRCDENHGFLAIVFLFLIVWSTDTMAYVSGRSLGGPKLWPSVSPNKTWSGFIGGVGSSAILSAVFALLVPGASPLKLGLIGLTFGIISQAGDLAESALKRHFNVKVASQFIPGHGGLMDRLDGLVAVAVAAALLALILNARAPATALLIG